MKNLIIIALLLTLTACGGGGSTDWDNWTSDPYYQEQRAETWANGECGTVIIGDSRVKGGYWYPWCNYGINGDLTTGVLYRLDDIKAKQPSAIIIQIGRNDLDVANHTVTETYGTYVEILEALDGYNVRVTSTIPDGIDHVELNALIWDLNELLEAYCTDNGIEYVDINKEMAPDGYLLYHWDGVHPDAVGYEMWLSMM